MRLTVIGTGYVGAVPAACMADIGHQVLGVDIDPARIAALTAGRTPFFEPGLGGMLKRTVDTGRLRFTTSTAAAARFATTHFVCVGTPPRPGSDAADLCYVEAAVAGLAAHLPGSGGLGESVAFLRQIDEINTRQRRRAVELAGRLIGGSFAGRRVAVLGAAFKPGSDDVRDSPALAVAEAVRARGAQVRVHDPEAADNARAAHPALQFAPEVTKTCDRADVVLRLTEWPQYQELDPVALASVVRTPAIVDARHTLDPKTWRAAGRRLCAPGRPGPADSDEAEQ